MKENGVLADEFLYDLAGHKVVSFDRSGNLVAQEFYAGDRHLATYLASTNQMYFHHTDWLGTVRLDTDANGNQAQICYSWPFGDNRSCNGVFTSANLFTDLFLDPDNTDHALYRQLSTTQGRWLSPDPAGLAAADLANPQSLNLYAYVLNNPMRAVDPLGLDCIWFDDAGDDWDEIDSEIDSGACSSSGGTWINGTIDPNSISYDPGPDTFNISSTDQGTGINYNSTVAANGPWYDPSQGQIVSVQNGVLDQSAFNWQIQSRPLDNVPLSGPLGLDHYYFYNTVNGQSVGLGPTKPTVTGPVPGKWETGESCQKNGMPVPGWLQQCVNQQIQNRGNAPNYCTFQGQVNVNSQCMNCMGWVQNTLQQCYNQQYPNRH